MKYLAALMLLAAATVSGGADNSGCVKNDKGEVVCGKGECATDQYKKPFCAKAGGGAQKDRYGVVVCGAGYCAKDGEGRIWCSKDPGGSAAVDSYKKVKCTGGCELASADKCEVPE